MKNDREILSPFERLSSPISTVCMLVVLGFFAAHEWANTGFFTERFGPMEKLALYAPMLLALIPPLVRTITGRKNPARLFDAATNISLAFGSFYLVLVFPFDFAHLTDVLPGVIRFFFSWINNDIGRLVLILQVVVGAIAGPLQLFGFLLHLQRAPATV